MTYTIQPDRIICHDSRQRADGSWLKFGLEAPITPFQNPVESLMEAARIVDDTFKSCNTPILHDANTGIPQTIPPIDYKAKERLEILIDNAQTYAELDGYFNEAKKHGLDKEWSAKADKLKDCTCDFGDSGFDKCPMHS